MNTKRILVSVVIGGLLTGSLFAAPGNDRARTKTTVRTSKPNTTTTVRSSGHTSTRTRYVSTAPTRTFSTRPVVSGTTGAPVRTRVVTRTSSYPYSSYRYGYSGYGYGYPYYGYSYGPSVSFGFGYPYDYGYYGYNNYYPYNYGYGYNYRSSYNYGSYYYNNGYGNGSLVIAVQSRLARMGYYRGPIDGIMGPGTSFAIRAYERDHGLRVDGAISGPLVRNMGVRY